MTILKSTCVLHVNVRVDGHTSGEEKWLIKHHYKSGMQERRRIQELFYKKQVNIQFSANVHATIPYIQLPDL